MLGWWERGKRRRDENGDRGARWETEEDDVQEEER
jgi:hypothetical protein